MAKQQFDLDRNLALEAVRVTEAAALAASRLMGRVTAKRCAFIASRERVVRVAGANAKIKHRMESDDRF